MFKALRKNIYPRFTLTGIFIAVGIIITFLFLPIIPNSGNLFEAYAGNCYERESKETCDKYINYIQSKVDDQKRSIPNHGEDSFGKFLYGLAGCEHSWDNYTTDSTGTYYGMYQYTTGTWQYVHEQLMGVSQPDIYDPIAQIDATIYLITTGSNGGFNNWPRCTDGMDADIGREWTVHTDGWPSPPPVATGTIKGEKEGISLQAVNRLVWLDAGSPSTRDDPYRFELIFPGVHTVHIELVPTDQLLSQVKYTSCNSTQPKCGWDGDPNHYHYLNNLRDPVKVSATEAKIEVDVPSNGIVDLWWHYPPYQLPSPCTEPSSSSDGLDFNALVPDVYAQETCELPPPNPPPNPTTQAVQNLLSCSDNVYGNVRAPFTVTGATKAEFEAYANGGLFYNSQRDDGAWQNLNPAYAYILWVDFGNLAPGTNYFWRVRAGNEGGWSSWVGGSWWNVAFCNPPTLPTNLRIDSLPSCSDSLYNTTVRWDTQGATSTTLELWSGDRNRRFWISGGEEPLDGSIGWSQEIVNLSPKDAYSWRVKAQNSAGSSDWVWGPNIEICSNLWNTFTLHDADGNYKFTFRPGETGYAHIGVWNLRGADAGAFWTKVYRDSSQRTDGCADNHQSGQFYTSSLAGPGIVSQTIPFIAPSSVGVYWFWSVVDATCAISETNESDNISGWPYKVTESAKAQLVVDYMALDRPSYFPGETVRAYLILRNAGGEIASNFSIDAFNETLNATCNNFTRTRRYSEILPATPFVLGPLDFVPYNLYFPAPQTPGTYTASAFIDSTCAVDEYIAGRDYESDNTNSAQYVVVSPTAESDSDFDGFSDLLEHTIGTDPRIGCAQTTDPNDADIDAWPPDFNKDTWADISDISLLGNHFGKDVGRKLERIRFDLNLDGYIDISDTAIVAGVFGKTCFVDPNADTDGDGFTNSQEQKLGTDPRRGCAATPTADDEPVDAWPLDFNDDQVVDGTDLSFIAARFGLKLNTDPFRYDLPRYNLVDDNVIDISDISPLGDKFGQSCGS